MEHQIFYYWRNVSENITNMLSRTIEWTFQSEGPNTKNEHLEIWRVFLENFGVGDKQSEEK